jgi:5'-deoxynucleotidase YfbR-like HD superfamily hydrolase
MLTIARTSEIADDVISLGRFSLLFGRVERATFHEDGRRRETDTDHAVMLGIIACGLAERFYPELDTGLIAQFALVHDLVEAYAGDTPTLKISADERTAKEQREKDALRRIAYEFSAAFPTIPHAISSYETGIAPEARFVKTVDKLVPKITHILNKGATLRAQGIKKREAQATYERQREELREYAADFPVLLDLRDVLVMRMMSGLEAD